jgi:putative addiction module component (TIGR02574 family)
MGNDARALLTKALALSDDDRAGLAAELLASLDEPTSDSQEDIERLWAIEIERRSNRVLSGDSRAEPWNEVRSRIERRASERTRRRANADTAVDALLDGGLDY